MHIIMYITYPLLILLISCITESKTVEIILLSRSKQNSGYLTLISRDLRGCWLLVDSSCLPSLSNAHGSGIQRLAYYCCLWRMHWSLHIQCTFLSLCPSCLNTLEWTPCVLPSLNETWCMLSDIRSCNIELKVFHCFFPAHLVSCH